jgi:hypothetical protein
MPLNETQNLQDEPAHMPITALTVREIVCRMTGVMPKGVISHKIVNGNDQYHCRSDSYNMRLFQNSGHWFLVALQEGGPTNIWSEAPTPQSDNGARLISTLINSKLDGGDIDPIFEVEHREIPTLISADLSEVNDIKRSRYSSTLGPITLHTRRAQGQNIEGFIHVGAASKVLSFLHDLSTGQIKDVTLTDKIPF